MSHGGRGGKARASDGVAASTTGDSVVMAGGTLNLYADYQAARAPIAQLIKIDEFSSIVEGWTRGFVGRGFAVDRIDRVIGEKGRDSGYVVVLGEPGVGKTALLAWLVKERGYVHHFNIRAQNVRTARELLGNICAQLVVRYALKYGELPKQATENSLTLSSLLAEAANKSDGPVVVLVDAIDEASDQLLLPQKLPKGVFFVVTSRPRSELGLLTDDVADVIDLDDAQFREAVATDVRTYVMNHHREHATQMPSRLAAWNVSLESFCALMVERSEGNFRYLVHVLSDILSERMTPAQVGDITRLPKGLQQYYRSFWGWMRSVDPARFETEHEPMVCLLAAAREPVSIAQLAYWSSTLGKTGWSRARPLNPGQVAAVIGEWRQFLNELILQSGERRYHIFHSSFRDFLADELALPPYDDAVIDAALAKIPNF
jgi:hypothetical protein